MFALDRFRPNHLFHRSLFACSPKNAQSPVCRPRGIPAATCSNLSPLMKCKWLFILGVAAILCLNAASGWTAQVTMAWDPNNSAVDGYRLFQRSGGNSYNYSQPVWSGSTTTCTVTQLSDGTRYYFVVRAYKDATESANSNEVFYDTPAVNRAPVANAGADQTVAGQSLVTLNGSASSDPDGNTLTYTWTQTSGTAVQLSNPAAARPTFTAPAGASTAVVLAFRLTVRDPAGLSAADTCQVQVNAAVAPAPAPPVDPPPIAEPGPNDGEGDTPSQNQPPLQPVLNYPANGETAVGLRPTFAASAFVDPDDGDRHAKTEWLITAQYEGRVVLNVTRTPGKTSLRVSRWILDPDTGYVAKVRYFDDKGHASQWSPAVAFSTHDDRSAVKVNTPLQTDINANRIPDADESDLIINTQAPDERHAIAIGIEGSKNIVSLDAAVSTEPEADDLPPDGVVFPYGLLSYRIQVSEPGEEAAVTLYSNERIDPQTVWMDYDDNGSWADCSTQMYPYPDGFAIERLITDGGQGDADGVANGTIVDLIAPMQSTARLDTGLEDNPSGDAGSSGGGGCFIRSLMD